MTSLRLTLAACLLGLSLAGCSSSSGPVASGAQDFPNSKTAVVGIAKTVLDTTRHSDSYAMQAPDSSGFTVTYPDEPDQSLSKALADTVDTTWWDLSDSSSGYVTRYYLYSDSIYTRRDTFLTAYYPGVATWWWTKGNAGVREHRGSIEWSNSSVESVRFRRENPDTNQVMDREWANWVFAPSNGVQVSIESSSRPGPDSSFDWWFDNMVDTIAILKKAGDDTLSWDRTADVDGDGILWEYGVQDSFVVFHESISTAPDEATGVCRSELWSTLLLHPTDLMWSFPLRYQSETRYCNGTTLDIEAGGPREDSLCYPGDTAWVHLCFAWPDDDTLTSLLLHMHVVPDIHPLVDTARNEATLVNAGVRCHTGPVIDASLTFVPSAAFYLSDTTLVGTYTMDVTLRPEGTAKVTGSVDSTGISAEYQDSRGETGQFMIEWDGTLREVQ